MAHRTRRGHSVFVPTRRPHHAPDHRRRCCASSPSATPRWRCSSTWSTSSSCSWRAAARAIRAFQRTASTTLTFPPIEGAPLAEQPRPSEPASRAANAQGNELPEHLPRETRCHHPKGIARPTRRPCACSECGGKLRQIGEDVAEHLEYVPGRFKVIRHVRPKLACVRCEGIFQAMAPSRPIARGLPGPALLAHVMVAKYCDHLPLYRQSRIYARDGVDIDRSTMVGWVEQGDELIDPLAAALGRYTLAGAKVHADDTPVPVLDPGRGRTKTGRLWVYVRDDRPCGEQGCAGGVVPVLARPRRRASPRAPQALPRHLAGRCLRRLRQAVRQRAGRARSL